MKVLGLKTNLCCSICNIRGSEGGTNRLKRSKIPELPLQHLGIKFRWNKVLRFVDILPMHFQIYAYSSIFISQISRRQYYVPGEI
jgi:hypothetical protein